MNFETIFLLTSPTSSAMFNLNRIMKMLKLSLKIYEAGIYMLFSILDKSATIGR